MRIRLCVLPATASICSCEEKPVAAEPIHVAADSGELPGMLNAYRKRK